MSGKDERFPPLPKPSLPREAPWREIEQIIQAQKTTVEKLDALISAISGIIPGVPPAPTEIPAPPELVPITSRLDSLISGIVTNKLTFITGQKDVTTAGTPEQIVEEDEDILIPDGYKVTIIAKPGNTNIIYFARTKADCASAARRFDGLSAGVAHSLKVDKLSKVWVDAAVNGEGVSWVVEQD